MTKTKYLKYPSNAIFLKSRELKDIRYDTYNDKDDDQDKDKYKDTGKYKDKDKSAKKYSTYAIFLKNRGYKDIKYDNGVECVQANLTF